MVARICRLMDKALVLRSATSMQRKFLSAHGVQTGGPPVHFNVTRSQRDICIRAGWILTRRLARPQAQQESLPRLSRLHAGGVSEGLLSKSCNLVRSLWRWPLLRILACTFRAVCKGSN